MSEQTRCKECDEYLFEREEIKLGMHIECKEALIQTDLSEYIESIYKFKVN